MRLMGYKEDSTLGPYHIPGSLGIHEKAFIACVTTVFLGFCRLTAVACHCCVQDVPSFVREHQI